jgi:hypothetical protein
LAVVVLGLETPQLGHAKFFSRSHAAVIRVYDEPGGVIGLIAQRNTVRPIGEKRSGHFWPILLICLLIRAGRTTQSLAKQNYK